MTKKKNYSLGYVNLLQYLVTSFITQYKHL